MLGSAAMTDAGNAPPQYQQGPPPQQWQGQPPKKSNTGKWIGLGCGGLILFALLLLGGCGLLIAIAGDDDDPDSSPAKPEAKASETRPTLFPGRPDAQKEDQEKNIGESAELSGYTATVNSASFRQALDDFNRGGFVVADVSILNRDNSAQPYNIYDWRLQSPNGTVVDPAITGQNTLGSGDLVNGGTAKGQITFEVGSTKGDFYLIYKPDYFDDARGIWKVPVS